MVVLHLRRLNVVGQPSFRICFLTVSANESVPSFKLENSERVSFPSSFGKNLEKVCWHLGHFIIRERASKKEPFTGKKSSKPDELVVLWTSADREVALRALYTFGSKRFKWNWKNVTLVVWGPSSKLPAEDKELQEYLSRIRDAGVKLARAYGVSDDLRRLGIEVK